MSKFLIFLMGMFFVGPIVFADEPSVTYEICDLGRPQDKNVKFTALHFPKHTPLNLTVKRVDGKIIHSIKVSVENNKLIEQKSNKEFVFTFLNLLEGEPFEYQFQSLDKIINVTTTIIPRPLETRDDNGHKVTLTLRSTLGEMYSAEASGFEPFEEVTCCSRSEFEYLETKMKASAEGDLITILLPQVIGKKSGEASFEIKGKNTKNLKINYWWGLGVMDKNRPQKSAKFSPKELSKLRKKIAKAF